jgi:hypothetical protein
MALGQPSTQPSVWLANIRALVEARHRRNWTDKLWLPIEMALLRGEGYQVFEFRGRLEQLTEVPFALCLSRPPRERQAGLRSCMRMFNVRAEPLMDMRSHIFEMRDKTGHRMLVSRGPYAEHRIVG